MIELSFTTLKILAFSKIILVSLMILLLVALYKSNKPKSYLIIISSSIIVFYVILSFPLEKMFWGNNGDEVFIFSFLSKVISGNFFSDFYYTWLPPFYPPLYFWATGTIGKIFSINAIEAAKAGVIGVLVLWFYGSYFWQKLYWKIIANDIKNNNYSEVFRNKWFWLIYPLIFFVLLDFGSIITKPYEVITALFACLLIGMISYSFLADKWSFKNYLYFGISGGILFLTYYFWWFILIPSLAILALGSKRKKINFLRIIYIGSIIFIISSPYLIPLFKSLLVYGMENWQAAYFYYEDLFTFIPWLGLSLSGLISLLGLVGLIAFRNNCFIRANLILFVFCYAYQLFSILLFSLDSNPIQAQKPFLFLGNACLSIGGAYLLIYLYNKYVAKFAIDQRRSIIIIFLLFFVSMLPFAKFIDNNEIIKHIENDLVSPASKDIAGFIQEYIPDYQNRLWLSSGLPDINAYLPLSYYISHNPHFSHPASIYSKRLELVKGLSSSKDPEEFIAAVNESHPKPIDSLLLYYDVDTKSYPLFFWKDNYPNAGKELRIDIPEYLINEDFWELKFDSGIWKIFLRV